VPRGRRFPTKTTMATITPVMTNDVTNAVTR
jgi:hypothetical protein